MDETMRRATLLLAVGLSTIVGCAHTSQVTCKIETPDAMRQLLSDRLPPGTNLDEARCFMEWEGFSCKIVRNGSFVEQWWNAQATRHEDIDFLDCRRTQAARQLFMAHVWGVALVLDGDVVEDVLVSHYFDGP